jgi:hypothetical protein
MSGAAESSPVHNGGRSWWAHFEFTRINIKPMILKNKIEDSGEASEVRLGQSVRDG